MAIGSVGVEVWKTLALTRSDPQDGKPSSCADTIEELTSFLDSEENVQVGS